MHRVLNFGSALQAYALQRVLFQMGCDNEIIDYSFPPKKTLKEHISVQLHFWLYQLRTGTFFEKSIIRYFKDFYKNHLTLSQKKYDMNTVIETNSLYDAFMTGSDQVWNPNWTLDDTSFLLSFVDSAKPRMSYASSFAIDTLPMQARSIYKKYLEKYQTITVRESSGVGIIKELTGKCADLVLDPTLLLEKKEYESLSKETKIKMREPYILVYMLTYMYNPFPVVNNIVRQAHKALGGRVVYLSSGKFSKYRKDCLCIDNIGPCEFVWLFQHASLVITSSFHGTAFASIFHKPLISTVKSKKGSDGRMPTLLKLIGGEKSIVEYNTKAEIDFSHLEFYQCNLNKLADQRSKSMKVLQDEIMLAKNTSYGIS